MFEAHESVAGRVLRIMAVKDQAWCSRGHPSQSMQALQVHRCTHQRHSALTAVIPRRLKDLNPAPA